MCSMAEQPEESRLNAPTKSAETAVVMSAYGPLTMAPVASMSPAVPHNGQQSRTVGASVFNTLVMHGKLQRTHVCAQAADALGAVQEQLLQTPSWIGEMRVNAVRSRSKHQSTVPNNGRTDQWDRDDEENEACDGWRARSVRRVSSKDAA